MGDEVSIRGRLYSVLNQYNVFEQQQGVVLAVFDVSTPATRQEVAEQIKAYHAYHQKSGTTYLLTMLTDNDLQMGELKTMNQVENVDGMAQKLLRGREYIFYIFRNNMFQTMCVELQRMQDIVDKFIETRGEAIPETITSVKQQDIKEDEERHERKKKRSRVKREV